MKRVPHVLLLDIHQADSCPLYGITGLGQELCLQAFMADVVEAERRDPQVHATEEGTGQLRFQMMEYVQFLYSFVRSQGAALPVQVYER